MSQDNIIQLDFSEEMKTSYRDYAVSVIRARALPDVRDGLKFETGTAQDFICDERTGIVAGQATSKKCPYRRRHDG